MSINTAVVGAARVVFGADTSDFDSKARGVEGVLGRLADKFQAVERRLKVLGAGVTLGITVPFAAMVRSVDKGAGSFEAAMKNVEAALDGVTGDQLKQLSDQARDLGPRVGKGATEAAEGIEALALAGLSASDILGGGLKATLDLAAAGMVDVAPAAALVTDVMGQFGKTAADLPEVVRNVVGAMDGSKFGFEDFQLALAQGGGVAAAAGLSFTDFATAVAATSAQFSSGSDAGTSFKTYLTTLIGKSDDAKTALSKLGIEFYDSSGKLKPLSEQARILQAALGDLTDESKQNALTPIFGADAARTAIGLMRQGEEGIKRLQAAVDSGDVEKKIQKRMEGSAAAGKRIAVAWQSVKIAIGETGLLDAITAIKNGFARMLEAVANAPPALLKVGAVFAALSAAIGPLLYLLGHIGAFLIARFIVGFGVIGQAIALIISPISTLIGMLGEAGLMRILGFIAGRFTALLGPIGWVIGAVILFKDSIIPVLEQLWAKMQATLGPPLEAMMQKVQGIFSGLANGPIGTAFGYLMTLLSGLMDVLGTAIAGQLTIVGEIIVRVLSGAISVINSFLDVVKGFVEGVSALLSGDFAGAWEAVKDIVEAVLDSVVNLIVAMVPEIESPLRAAYNAAKAWLADGFAMVVDAVIANVKSVVDYIAAAFPNVVAAAQGVYAGVKAWLVDKFGGILTWIKGAAKYIGDTYQALKEKLGLGVAIKVDEPKEPKEPSWFDKLKAAMKPKRTVSFDDPKTPKKGAGGSGGRDVKYDAQNRAELEVQAQLEAARLRNDQETVKALEAKLDLQRQIEAYQRTGLSLAEATTAANRDMKLIADARATQTAKQIADDERSFQIRLAEISGNGKLEESLKRQEFLQERIEYWRKQGLATAQATAAATAEQARLDAAVAERRQREAARADADRQIDLARARGDSEDSIRRMEAARDQARRSEDLQRGADGRPPMDKAEADAQAATEALENEQARQTGIWRDTIKGGLRAAMDGNLGDYLKNWWKDRVAKGMEEALNSLSDLIQKLFSSIDLGGSGSGGGGLGGLLSGIGKLFGNAGGPISEAGAVSGGGIPIGDLFAKGGISGNFPGFATGGSFRVGGMAGIDRNLISFRATRGEMVDIRKGGADAGAPQRMIVEPSPWFDVRAADAAEPSIQSMGVRATNGGATMAQRSMVSRMRQKLGRR